MHAVKSFLDIEVAKSKRYLSHCDKGLKWLMADAIARGLARDHFRGTRSLVNVLSPAFDEIADLVFEREAEQTAIPQDLAKYYQLHKKEAYKLVLHEWDIAYWNAINEDFYKLGDYLAPFVVKEACCRFDTPIFD